MKHLVALQSKNVRWLAFFCVVCNMIGMHIVLSWGRNILLDITQAKAILLRCSKNPNAPLGIVWWLPIHFMSQGFVSSDNGGLCYLSSWGSIDASPTYLCISRRGGP